MKLFAILYFLLLAGRAQSQASIQLPPVTLTKPDGKSQPLRSLPVKAGKVNVLITFSPYWCAPCLKLINELDAQITRLGETKPVPLTVWAVDVDKTHCKEVLEENPVNESAIELLLDPTWVFQDACKTSNAPTILFLDKNNKIIYAHTDFTIKPQQVIDIAGYIQKGFLKSGEPLYFDSAWLPVPKEKALYYRKLEKTPEGYRVNDYYKNGKLQMTGLDELVYPAYRTGEYRYYTDNGKLSKTEYYRANKLNGPMTFYYESGKIYNTGGTYVDGFAEGLWRHYYENGTIKAETNWVKGKKEGSAKGYDDKGSLLYELSFKNGSVDYNKTVKIYQKLENGQLLIKDLVRGENNIPNFIRNFVDGWQQKIRSAGQEIHISFHNADGLQENKTILNYPSYTLKSFQYSDSATGDKLQVGFKNNRLDEGTRTTPNGTVIEKTVKKGDFTTIVLYTRDGKPIDHSKWTYAELAAKSILYNYLNMTQNEISKIAQEAKEQDIYFIDAAVKNFLQ